MKIDLKSPLPWIAAAFLVSGTAILGALAVEHVGGYRPCKLCLEQREPYYAGLVILAIAFATALGASSEKRNRAYVVAFSLLAAAIFAKGAYLGVRHAGIEWKWWEGPGDCGAMALAGAHDASSLLKMIQNTKAVSCTEAALRVFGLSLAGWNALASAAVAALSLAGAAAAIKGGKAEAGLPLRDSQASERRLLDRIRDQRIL